jgi:hypothetical protein
LDWRAKVELCEQIHLEYEFGVGSIIGAGRSWAFIGAWCVRQCGTRFLRNARRRSVRR